MIHREVVLMLGLLSCAVAVALSEEPKVDRSQMPRVSPTEPERALATFRIKPGFRLELVAAEPLVVDPIAMAFDEDARLYVVEMRDYSERRPERLGRIRRLEDSDADGRMDRSVVFAQDLPWPTAVTCWAGGVFVGVTPDILYLKDTDGDGVADVRETIFTGFAADAAPFETNRLNVQAMLNSFQWSLDHRIHGATSLSGGKVRLVDSPFTRAWLIRGGVNPDPALKSGTPLELRGRDFSFDLRALDLRAESGGGQHGLSFDNDGRKFVCANSSHLQTLMYEDRYAVRNPHYTMPRALVSIAADGDAAPVFRLSPDEPWRVLRTQWRVAGLVPGPIEGGGRPSGYFTGATGVTIYRGDALGEEWVGDAFVADCGSNLVHRKKIRPDGVSVKGERAPDEQNVEFLASTDNWFRPVQFANAPDGALYIADMYREVIEHPWSLPASLKQHLDLNSGNDRGRIYRVVREGSTPRPLPRLSRASTAELVETLEHPNGWHCDTAARLLHERRDAAAIALLRDVVQKSRSSSARLHALGALDGFQALDERALIRALDDPSPSVRVWALRWSERWFESELRTTSNSVATSTLARKLVPLAGDPDSRVKYQLAFTLGSLPTDARIPIALALLTNGPVEAWTRHALLSSLDHGAGELFAELARREFNFPSALDVVPALAGLIGARHDASELAVFTARWPELRDRPALALATMTRFADALESRGRSVKTTLGAERFASLLDLVRTALARLAASSERPESMLDAIRLIGLAPEPEATSALLPLLEARQPPATQQAALTALSRFPGTNVVQAVLARWSQLAPARRTEAISLFSKRTERVAALLDAMDRGAVSASELSASQAEFFRSHPDATLRERTRRLLGQVSSASRQDVIDAMAPALRLPGVASRGRRLFSERCASCHRLGGEGHAVGPDLASARTAGKEKLLTNIVDPNREVAANFASYLVETRDGEFVTGILAQESAASVVLRQPNGLETSVPRANITSLRSEGKSLMPEGLEAGWSAQDVADLLEFLTGAN